MKKCSVCLVEKNKSEFYTGKATCKECYNKKSKNYNKQHREKLNCYQRNWYYKLKANSTEYAIYLQKRREKEGA